MALYQSVTRSQPFFEMMAHGQGLLGASRPPEGFDVLSERSQEEHEARVGASGIRTYGVGASPYQANPFVVRRVICIVYGCLCSEPLIILLFS